MLYKSGMNLIDCIPCFARQAVDLARQISDDESYQAHFLRKAFRGLSEMDFTQPPPAIAQYLHHLASQMIDGDVDASYSELKHRFNQLALKLYPELRERIRADQRPITLAVKLAIAGNAIDAGIKSTLSDADLHEAVELALSSELAGDSTLLVQAIRNAGSILYLADNAGEIVFDKLLLELLPRHKITVVVRGRDILNDATMDDALATGLTEIVNVIDNGSDAPGTLLPDCGSDFLRCLEQADLVIAKGQGNFETLKGALHQEAFFLMKVKCEIVAAEVGIPMGSLIIHHQPAAVLEPAT